MSEPFIMVPKHIAARTDLPAGAKLAFAAIMDRMGRNKECWPGVRRLAQDIGCDKSTAQRAVDKLEEAGLVEVERRDWPKTNRYRVRKMQTYAKCGRTQDAEGRTQNADGDVRETRTEQDRPKKKTHKGAQRAGDEAGDALGLAVLYRDLVLPGDRTCTPAGRATRNAEKLLKNHGATVEQLTAAVTNYAKALDAEDRPAGYRKAGGNFFGRDGVWREYLEPLSAEELQRLRNDQHRNGNRSGKGGAIIPPGDFSGREDAIAL